MAIMCHLGADSTSKIRRKWSLLPEQPSCPQQHGALYWYDTFQFTGTDVLTAAILISRQPNRPHGNTPWVRALQRALAWVATNKLSLRTSIGMATWELQVSLATELAIPMTVVIPALSPDVSENEVAKIVRDFRLEGHPIVFESVILCQENPSRHDLMQARDQTVVANADVLIPIDVRPDGTMARLIEQRLLVDKRVFDDFRTRVRTKAVKHAYQMTTDQLNPELARLGTDYVTHYTRTANGPWPGESMRDYYRAIVRSDSYPRHAAATLGKIIEERRIVGSARHMPRHIPTVSFTFLRPAQLVPLIRWRSRYGQMSFEPYGVAIKHEQAVKLGIVPVEYHERRSYDGVPDEYAWRCQSVGVKSDWRKEKECRCRGDCDLSGVPPSEMLLLTRFRAEADMLSHHTGIEAIPFIDK